MARTKVSDTFYMGSSPISGANMKMKKETSKTQKQIESILVDAGEQCPDDYQNGFDWNKYMIAVNKVVDLFGELKDAKKI